MSYSGHRIIRTVRCKNEQVPGTLARLLTAVAEEGGSVANIELIRQTHRHTIREIVIQSDDEEQTQRIINAMVHNEGTEVLEVRDDVLELHVGGKIAIRSRYIVNTPAILRRVYTPGVAEVCKRIENDPSLARMYTSISHFVAIITDGTAILGLGDIGPVAGMPVMEGKAMLMESFVGLSGMPILLNTKDVDTIVETIAAIAPTFSFIQLEDISAPRCFEIEERLQKRLDIPVMHDDQHGTAVVVTAALTNACKQAGTDLMQATIGQIGLGAAGMAISRMAMGLTGHSVLGADLSQEALQRFSDYGGTPSSLREIMDAADIVVATTGVPNLIKPEWVRKGQIILAISNPKSEIDPGVAMKAGAAFAADGKSVNNVLGFPGIIRGAVDAYVPYVSREMYLAAAQTIADMAAPGDLVPSPLDKKVHFAVARAVAQTARAQGLARADLAPYEEE